MNRDPWAGRIRALTVFALVLAAIFLGSFVATVVRVGIAGAFVDAAGVIPVRIWIGLAGLGFMAGLVVWAMTAPLTTPEQREEIARCHREWTGDRGMPSTRSTAPSRGGTSQSHPAQRGQAAPALGRGRPRRDR